MGRWCPRPMPDGPSLFTRFLEKESLRPDLKRAVRMTIAFMVPLSISLLGPWKFGPVHACIAAQTIAMVDVRGAYAFRFSLLMGLSLILTAAVWLGVIAGGNLALILMGTIAVVAAGGLWRHLSSEHGPGLAISSGLMFFLTVAEKQSMTGVPQHATLLTLAGAVFGVLLQVAAWPVQPQHPLRKTVAESWLALADLIGAMPLETPNRPQALADFEAVMRTTLNRTQTNLVAVGIKRGKLPEQLEALNLIAARLAMRSMVLNTALETHAATLGVPRSTFEPMLESLGNVARSVATCVVSRQASHLASLEVRLTRLQGLISVLQGRVRSQIESPSLVAELSEILAHIAKQLPGIGEVLTELTSQVEERMSASLELADLKALRPLAFELDPWRKPEAALVRHTIRVTCLAVVGVLVMYFGKLPHGYWIPFTILVVLQPDYGSTRQRAAQRMLGTLAGGLLASVLLWVHPPIWGLLLTTAVSISIFGYFVKKNYGIAVIFITLMVALLTEASHPVTLGFTLERIGSTLGGGLFALVAAAVFWPVWEASRFPGIMATALEKNILYLKIVAQRLIDGGVYDDT
ncbi:MAG: rane protein, partial [Akkermansiaceae bacterium]|nr:rane protein [Akkermansiaceae bacterium]